MHRALEIINGLRKGIETLLISDGSSAAKSLRLFNFEQRRVSLRVELASKDDQYYPMGMIDVVEFPGSAEKASCRCTLTELVSGKTEELMLKPKSSQEKEVESLKILNFFRSVLQLEKLPDDQVQSTDVSQNNQETNSSPRENHLHPIDPLEGTEHLSPLSNGMPERTRGAQEKPVND